MKFQILSLLSVLLAVAAASPAALPGGDPHCIGESCCGVGGEVAPGPQASILIISLLCLFSTTFMVRTVLIIFYSVPTVSASKEGISFQ